MALFGVDLQTSRISDKSMGTVLRSAAQYPVVRRLVSFLFPGIQPKS
jgi:hypothetical protein